MVSTGVSKTLSLGSNPSTPTNMEVTFKYNGKIITTPNLEKKLKRMKLTMEDIEIVNLPIKKEKDDEYEESDKEMVIVRSTEDFIRRVCYIPKGKHIPISELFRNHIWNPETKTGVKGMTKEMLMTMYYEY